jgi:hypothetical protein
MVEDVRVIGEQRAEELPGAWLRRSSVSAVAVAPGPSASFFPLRGMGGGYGGEKERRSWSVSSSSLSPKSHPYRGRLSGSGGSVG